MKLVDIEIQKLVDIETPKIKVSVMFNQEYLLKALEDLNDDYLEENRIFVILIHSRPVDKIEQLPNYSEVVEKYPNSKHILDRPFYVGDMEGTLTERTTSVLNMIFGEDSYVRVIL